MSVAIICVSSSSHLSPPLGAEIGERVIVDRDSAAKPLIGEVVLAEPFELPRAADASQRGEHPKRDEQPGIVGVAAGMTLDGLDVLEPGVEIELADKAPDNPRLRIGVEPFVERRPAHFDLIADRDAKPRRPSTGLTRGLSGERLGEVVGMEWEGGHESLAVRRGCGHRDGRTTMVRIISCSLV